MKSLYPNIDEELKERNMDYRQLANVLGISESSMYRRMVGTTKWALHEAIRISWYFNGVDINKLFEKKERG